MRGRERSLTRSQSLFDQLNHNLVYSFRTQRQKETPTLTILFLEEEERHCGNDYDDDDLEALSALRYLWRAS